MSSVRAFARYALRESGRMPEHRDRIAEEPLEPRILLVRGQRVILDVDLARLYGVTTKRLNEGFKRNRKRFPDDFAFQLSAVEFAHLRSSSPPSHQQTLDQTQNSPNWSQIAASSSRATFATGSSRHRGVSYRPWAFTEHGALMAANVLRSERAVQMSIFVIRAFVRLREHVAANAAIQSGLPKSTGRCFSTTRRCATSTADYSPCSLRLPRRRSAASASSAAFSSVSTLRKSGSDPDFRVFSAPAPRRRPRREVSSMQLLYPSAPCRSWCTGTGAWRARTARPFL